ncbi:hypothetical protein GGI43DRAFT_397324 [Trichoderma evansii]
MTPVVKTMGPELQYFIDQGIHRTAMKRFAQPEDHKRHYILEFLDELFHERQGHVGRWLVDTSIHLDM